MPYFVSGIIGVIVAALAITTMTEPKRTSISEEADGDVDASSKPAARAVTQQVPVATETGAEKTSIWKVLFQPKILILCVAASIRHTGTCSDFTTIFVSKTSVNDPPFNSVFSVLKTILKKIESR